MNIDKPLDDVIAEKRKSRAPRRPRGPRNGAPPATAAAPAPAGPAAGGRAPRNAGNPNAGAAAASSVHVGDKIIVSNLPTDVDERQIKVRWPSRSYPTVSPTPLTPLAHPQELFATTVGPVRQVSLSYNAQGQSKGIATVQFNKFEHATSAYQQYNKRLIDGGGSLPFL